jgi:hypothetical protein
MLRRTRFRASLLGLCALAAYGFTIAPTNADDYPACAKYDSPLAYNACLAQQGPVARGSKATSPPPGEGAGRSPWAAHRRFGQTFVSPRGRSGRMTLELTVSPSAPGVRTHNRSR